MKFLNIVGNSIGCSASGERLVSAARDGDLQEAKAILRFNPRLAKYTTFGGRNSPLHYSAAHGHHEIVSLLIESGLDINLRNYRGQTALMQACQHGHWEVVLTLILFKANIHRVDCLNGSTALHLAALNGHYQCIRLLVADYIPSIPDFWNHIRKKGESLSKFNYRALSQVINKPADGGITALHVAALNSHVESVQLLLDLGASVLEVTVEDGTTIDLIGGGSTALHYAACGGNAQCCQILIARGASLAAENSKGFTPLMIALLWHRNWLEEILSRQPECHSKPLPSPHLSLPLMSIVKVARECGWRSRNTLPCGEEDPCVVCLERSCTVAAKGCNHEFCTNCALYLCSINSTSTSTNAPPGSISCPLCRYSVVKFVKLPHTAPLDRGIGRSSSSLGFCRCSSELTDSSSLTNASFCKPEICRSLSSSLGASFRFFNFRKFSSIKIDSSLCVGGSDVCSSFVSNINVNSRKSFARISRSAYLIQRR